jgi:hypothetical protein
LHFWALILDVFDHAVVEVTPVPPAPRHLEPALINKGKLTAGIFHKVIEIRPLVVWQSIAFGQQACKVFYNSYVFVFSIENHNEELLAVWVERDVALMLMHLAIALRCVNVLQQRAVELDRFVEL